MPSRYINPAARRKAVYISGRPGYGKSTLIHTMAYQDMMNGEAMCVIDAKGGPDPLIESLLDWVPESRKNDVIYLDLQTPIPINFMECENQNDRRLLVSDIVGMFKRLDEGWGVRMESILRFTIHALLAYGPCTFLDIYRFLTEDAFRHAILKSEQVQSIATLRVWWAAKGEKLVKGDAADPITVSRMSEFVLSENLSTILGTQDAELSIAQAIEDKEHKKIILVQLEDDDESRLYGSLLISKIQQALFRRKEQSHPFMLYVDEFQDLRSSEFRKMLSKGRAFNLCLTISNHYLAQITDATLRADVKQLSQTLFIFNMEPENAANFKGTLKEPPPPQKPDIKALRAKVKHLEACERAMDARITMCAQKSWDTQPDRDGWSRAYRDLNNAKAELKKAEQVRPKPLTFLERIPHLPIGYAVYHSANSETRLIKTPPPPPHPRSVGKTSHAEWIKANTLATYGQKRAGDNSPSNSAMNPHTEGDDPEPSGSPDIPANKN